MAAVLILCSLGLMGWSVLGLINPLRFAQGSRARAFGVGVIGFALLMVGGAMLPPTPGTNINGNIFTYAYICTCCFR